MPKCIFCQNELTQDTTPEHVLLNALGGRMTTKRAICSDHNNHLVAQSIRRSQRKSKSFATTSSFNPAPRSRRRRSKTSSPVRKKSASAAMVLLGWRFLRLKRSNYRTGAST
ncbi:HNH endonuclease [Bradyrhizobium arachidis]|uniref:HNH endonuclease n=1 Tax=Bradyrhizobium arachidis TaxID=858423 RepID=UPI002204AC34|nr:HNH endonuclease [Bradyrhizobium arachidis]